MSWDFQVSEVKKPLVAVWRIVEKGNRVQFGPEAEDNFVENIGSGEKIWMRKVGGSYVMDVDFVESGFRGQA